MTSESLEFPPSRQDVGFGRGGETGLRCDVYLPADTSKRTAIIFLHGGGFRGGRKEAIAAKLQAYVRRGYVCIAAQYRLSGEAKWPAPLEDVKCAVRWARTNARDLGIDPARVAVGGFSAGGHLAMMASGTQQVAGLEGNGGNEGVSSDVAACIAYYPPHILRRQADGSPHVLMTEDSEEKDYAAASPLYAVSAASAPTMLFHGTADVTVLPESSRLLYDALIGAGVAAELHTFHGVPHEFDTHREFSEQCAALADLFLDHVLVNPRTYPPFAPRPQPAG